MTRRRTPRNPKPEAAPSEEIAAPPSSEPSEVLAEEVEEQIETEPEGEDSLEDSQEPPELHEDDEPGEPDFGDGPSAPLRRAYWERSATFLDYLQRVQSEPDVESIHELRVSSRRLVAVLELLTEMIGEGPLKKLRATCKKIRRSCGELRDLQVQLEFLGEEEQWDDYRRYVEGRLPQVFERALKKLTKIKAAKLEKKLELIDSLATALVEGAEPPNYDHLALLAHPFVETRACAEFAAQHMDFEHPVTIHALRVALKKMRYQAEFLEDLGVLHASEEAWQAVRAFHKASGGLQDLEVLNRSLDAYWAEYPPVREVQLKILGRLWKERGPHFAELQGSLPLDAFELSESIEHAGEE